MSLAEPQTAVPILVVGGGIGGLAAALAIGQSGREVHLLERAPQFAEIGAGLQVGPNATRVLDRLKLLDRALELAVLPEHGVMLDAITARQLTVLDLGAAFLARYGYPYVVPHRSDLLAILLDACREQPSITLENNKAVASVWSAAQSAGMYPGSRPAGTGQFTTGIRCRPGSPGRAALLGDAAHPMPQYLGQGAWQAREDAYELGRQLARSPHDIPAALACFQERRMARTTRCPLGARPWGQTWPAADEVMVGRPAQPGTSPAPARRLFRVGLAVPRPGSGLMRGPAQGVTR